MNIIWIDIKILVIYELDIKEIFVNKYKKKNNLVYRSINNYKEISKDWVILI